MLVAGIDDLFDEIPNTLRCIGLKVLSDGLTAHEIGRVTQTRAAFDVVELNFLGAGA